VFSGLGNLVYRLCGKEKMKAPALHFFSCRSLRSEQEPEGLKGGKCTVEREVMLENRSQCGSFRAFPGIKNHLRR
jgi:hypothetical protein